MPRITLRHTPTGKEQDFEPVDAREVLSMENSEYEPIDQQVGSLSEEQELLEGVINIPQHQGEDAEMDTGLSIEKYGRANLVKAYPGQLRMTRPSMPRTADMPEGA